MSIAMLSAISVFYADAAFAARPLAAAASAAAAQVASEEVSTELEPNEAVIIGDATGGEETGADETAPDETVPDEAATQSEIAPEAAEPQLLDLPVVFENESDEALAEKLKSYLEEIETLTGDFTQIAPSGAISSGKFYLRRPGLLRFEYAPPTPLLIVANGGMVYVRDEALETTDSYPVGRTPLKFLLRKKLELDKAKIIRVDRGVDSFSVTFGSDGDEAEGELTVTLNAPDLSLTRWIVRDIQNGITVVNLDNVKSGDRLANRLFQTPETGGEFLKN